MKGGVVPPGIEPGTHGFSVQLAKHLANYFADFKNFSRRKRD